MDGQAIGDTPPFWWRKAGWQAWVLSPVAFVYGRFAGRRLRRRNGTAFELPVIRIASLAIGGLGCTEAAAAIALAARRSGMRPGIIACGSPGAYAAPHLVDRDHDLAKHVGDEALQLARAAPTALCADRLAAARLLAREGHDLVIVADGQAAERLRADCTLVVIDASRGLGNGHVTPAGPVRAPLVDQLAQADALLKIGGGDGADRAVRLAARAGRPIYEAVIRPREGIDLSGRRWLAFAGVADPEQFFAMVVAAGGEIALKRTFAEGHLYADDELQDLGQTAEAEGLSIVTTQRDAQRLHHGSEAARALRLRAVAIETELVFEFPKVPETLIGNASEACRLRRFNGNG